MRHIIEFKNPLTIDVNVSVTQKQDERVAELQKRLADALSGVTVGPEVQAKIDKLFGVASSNVDKVQKAVEENKQ